MAGRAELRQFRQVHVLCLTRYDAAGASSRYRFYQYLPYLRAAGFDVDEAPLLGSDYVERLYGRRPRDLLALARSVVRRTWHLLGSRRHDVLWVEKELLPFFPAVLEGALRLSGARVVLDFDDAVFHQYDQHPSALVRAILGRKIDRAMAAAALVVAGNEYLAARARAAGATVEVLPTVVDTDRYDPSPPTREGPLTLGWIGSPSTQEYLRDVAPVLAAFCKEHRARVLAIGPAPTFTLPDVPLEVVPWSEDGEPAVLREIDVGLMPIPDTPWARGKCGLKLLQYMASGRPTVASAVGANREIVVHGETGLLASSPGEWRSALEALASSRELRTRMGGAGRARVEAHYSLRAAAPRLASLLARAARH